MERSVPSLRVQIGQEVVLRRAEVEVLAHDVAGRPIIVHMRPELRAGEILCERLGDIPIIFTDGEGAALLPPVVPLDFDAWMSHRIKAAHEKFMEQTSYHCPSDWRVFSPEAIMAYINGPGV